MSRLYLRERSWFRNLRPAGGRTALTICPGFLIIRPLGFGPSIILVTGRARGLTSSELRSVQVAGDVAFTCKAAQHRSLDPAARDGMGTARMEGATGRRS